MGLSQRDRGRCEMQTEGEVVQKRFKWLTSQWKLWELASLALDLSLSALMKFPYSPTLCTLQIRLYANRFQVEIQLYTCTVPHWHRVRSSNCSFANTPSTV